MSSSGLKAYYFKLEFTEICIRPANKQAYKKWGMLIEGGFT